MHVGCAGRSAITRTQEGVMSPCAMTLTGHALSHAALPLARQVDALPANLPACMRITWK